MLAKIGVRWAGKPGCWAPAKAGWRSAAPAGAGAAKLAGAIGARRPCGAAAGAHAPIVAGLQPGTLPAFSAVAVVAASAAKTDTVATRAAFIAARSHA